MSGTMADEAGLAARLAFLSRPEVYPEPQSAITVLETRLSWVFLGDDRVYKLKKPVRDADVDFTTVEARRRNCECEVRLNRRLAEDVYFEPLALHHRPGVGLSFQPGGAVVDWLVPMRRLPETAMLDARLLAGSVTDADIDRLARRLVRFYGEQAEPVPLAPGQYRQRFEQALAASSEGLRDPRFGLPEADLNRLLQAQQQFLDTTSGLLADRAGHVCEAHGDLRPEHVCLSEPLVIIDCLEFDRSLRLLDPIDELAYLALECRRLGNPAAGQRLLRTYGEHSGDHPDPTLVAFYQSHRACIRAGLALRHVAVTGDAASDRWRQRGRAYLDAGLAAIDQQD